MLKKLIKLANDLDLRGLTKEADLLDSVITKIAAVLETASPDEDCTPLTEEQAMSLIMASATKIGAWESFKLDPLSVRQLMMGIRPCLESLTEAEKSAANSGLSWKLNEDSRKIAVEFARDSLRIKGIHNIKTEEILNAVIAANIALHDANPGELHDAKKIGEEAANTLAAGRII